MQRDNVLEKVGRKNQKAAVEMATGGDRDDEDPAVAEDEGAGAQVVRSSSLKRLPSPPVRMKAPFSIWKRGFADSAMTGTNKLELVGRNVLVVESFISGSGIGKWVRESKGL